MIAKLFRSSTSFAAPQRTLAASFANRDGWTRSFQTSSKVEADSMGNLIDKGKEGAEFVVSGKFYFVVPPSSTPPSVVKK
jgi:hypothetical protein